MKINKLLMPTSLSVAAKLFSESKKSAFIAGGTFLRLNSTEYDTVIDLSKAGLEYVTYLDDSVEIGSMTTLRRLESDKKLNEIFDDAFKYALENIVGIQFRNIATIGGSVAAKLGFSEIITMLVTLDASIKIYGEGVVKIYDYIIGKSFKEGLIEKIIVPIKKVKFAYRTVRNTSTDIPEIILAVSKSTDEFKIAVGARPAAARLAEKAQEFIVVNTLSKENYEKAAKIMADELSFGTDIRATAEYRKTVSKSLLIDMLLEVMK